MTRAAALVLNEVFSKQRKKQNAFYNWKSVRLLASVSRWLAVLRKVKPGRLARDAAAKAPIETRLTATIQTHRKELAETQSQSLSCLGNIARFLLVLPVP